MEEKDVYKTIDMSFTAFLCMEGYTLLGAVLTGNQDKPQEAEFLITHQDEDKRKTIMEDILKYRDDWFVSPFRVYYTKLRMVKKESKNPIDPKRGI